MLVGYSSSSEEDEEENVKRKLQNDDNRFVIKRCKTSEGSVDCSHILTKEEAHNEAKPRLPLPESVLEMFHGQEEKATEDKSLHGGRVRSFQHERGNWATYVYLPYMPEDGFGELLEELTQLTAACGLPMTCSSEFHLSLSHTVVLRHHWIQPFVLSLQSSLCQYPRFTCVADRLKVYTNQEKSRTFVGVEVSTGHAHLLDLVKIVDQTMEEFELSTFYQNPSFHVSLAWCVGDFADRLRAECLQDIQILMDSHDCGAFPLRLTSQELRCKAGNKVFSFQLH